MKMIRNIANGFVVLAIVALASAAHGQIQSTDASTTLFKKGLEDMLAGRYDTGCPALAESYRLAPLPGALFTLAECEYKWGKHAAALSHYQSFLDRVVRMNPTQRLKQKAREQVARTQVDALTAIVPKLTLQLPVGAPPTTVVVRNGLVVPPAALGVPLPVDLGLHQIEVRLPSGAVGRQTVNMIAGEDQQLMLQLPPEIGGIETGTGADEPSEPFPWPWNVGLSRQIAYGVGGLGLIGIVVGSVTGGLAIGKKSTIDDQCNDAQVCTPEGKEAADAGQALATASTVTLSIGIPCLAGAVVLWILEPFDDDETVSEAGSLHPWVAPVAGDARGMVFGVGGTW